MEQSVINAFINAVIMTLVAVLGVWQVNLRAKSAGKKQADEIRAAGEKQAQDIKLEGERLLNLERTDNLKTQQQLRDVLADSLKDNRELKGRNEKLAKQYLEQDERLLHLTNDLASAQTSVKELNAANAEHQATIGKLEKSIGDMQRQAEARETQLTTFTQKVMNLNNEMGTLRRTLGETRTERDQLQQTVKEKDSELSQRDLTIKELRDELKTVSDKMEALKRRVEELEHKEITVIPLEQPPPSTKAPGGDD